ncbi:MAG: hypothetical protein FWE23_00375 [Chitinivibrionia bacterium]|jgi:hypothetical protein|nr:hypothetical protein [Chitinivibrionia bacterium]
MKKSFVFILLFTISVFANIDRVAMRAMMSHIDDGRSFLIGIAERRSADFDNVLVRYMERVEGTNYSVDVMEFYVNERLSFFVANNNWVRGGSSGTFDGIGLTRFVRKKNARNEVKRFFNDINFHRQSGRAPMRVM